MWYRTSADLVVVVHLLFICFIVGGVFLTWRWPWVIWVHLPAVLYGALIEFAGFSCPLTVLENDLRVRAGEAGYSGGFIEHYVEGDLSTRTHTWDANWAWTVRATG